MSVVRPAATAARVAVVMLGVGLLAGWRREAGRSARVALGVALVAGLAVVALAALRLRGFDAARNIYNAWMWPPFCMLLAAPLGAGWRPRLMAGAGLVLIAALAVGSAQLARHGPVFAHGPQGPLVGLIGALGPAEVAVVHDDVSAHVALLAAPLRYAFGTTLAQYQRIESGSGMATRVRPRPGARPLPGPVLATVELDRRYALVLRGWTTPDRALAAATRRAAPAPVRGPAARDLDRSDRWVLRRAAQYTALQSAGVLLYERRDR
jgi:hypothetical protein